MKKQAIEHTRLLALSLLAGEDMYGYQMIVELARRSNHTFDMKEGTLYPVLHGLEQEGFVEAYRKQAPTGRERKYYHLTRKGQGALREEEAAPVLLCHLPADLRRVPHGLQAPLFRQFRTPAHLQKGLHPVLHTTTSPGRARGPSGRRRPPGGGTPGR